MAVSKRLRYEILRRDNHTCRYCGEPAPDVKLTIDHVVPVSLGGSDEPKNLVAACPDCNAGKAASNPDAPLVDNVNDDAIRWAKAIELATQMKLRARQDDHEFYMSFIEAVFDEYKANPAMRLPQLDSAGGPDAAKRTITRFRELGLDGGEQFEAMLIAMADTRISEDSIWNYFCGVCWRKVDGLHEVARSLIEAGEV